MTEDVFIPIYECSRSQKPRPFLSKDGDFQYFMYRIKAEEVSVPRKECSWSQELRPFLSQDGDFYGFMSRKKTEEGSIPRKECSRCQSWDHFYLGTSKVVMCRTKTKEVSITGLECSQSKKLRPFLSNPLMLKDFSRNCRLDLWYLWL